ncbi:hypothetical protein GOL25_30730 [Sinorhizobium medicae]|nr:hypothetical protein [Sinorhizobium medicae]
MSSRATGRAPRAIILVVGARERSDELDRPAWTLRRGLPMEDSGIDAGHMDEFDLLDAQMTSGIPLCSGRSSAPQACPAPLSRQNH